MKLHKLTYLALCSILFGVFLNSCKKDKIDVDALVGDYTVVQSCVVGEANYTTTIEALPFNDSNGVGIFKFPGGFSSSAFAEVKGDKLIIPNQHNDDTSFGGEGTFDGKTLTIEFFVFENNVRSECTATFTKN